MESLKILTPVFIGFGLIFDLLSLLYGIIGLAKQQYSSGFPIIGAACYTVAVLSSLLFNSETAAFTTTNLALSLLVIHIICQAPCFILARKYR